ncbi:cation:proton antiporter [Streptosporangium sp. 'caverna']|uniref:cation:proton antiporter n=1 Tax=Streptosporangium sp. 'caverna' TaxID=2202249 RepID=UPI000D7D5AFF|nr:cation:proton antiporter [Streptosporangium sp. 'caverna']AWS44984.1 cation/H(+) antiporter [Streptosporangium sp. 'caverna']
MVLATAPVAVIPAPDLMVLLLQLGLLLGLATVLGRISVRFGMPALLGELCAGILIGPSLLANVAPEFSAWLLPTDPARFHMIDAVGQLGVLLLVGLTGMHLDLGFIRRQGKAAAWISGTGLVIPLALGVGIGFLAPPEMIAEGVDHMVFALFLGVALCVSAIPVIAKILMEMRLLHRDIGQLILSSAVIDDVVGWFLLSVVSALATAGARTGQAALTAVAMLAGLVLVALLFGRRLVAKVLRAADRGGSATTIAAVVVMILLSASATQAMGFEAILGAFICGALVGSSPDLRVARLAPLQTLVAAVLAPIFFATAGLRMDLTELANPPVLVAGIVVLAVAIAAKFAGAYLGARIAKRSRWEALALGAGLNSRGVIEVIIAMVGLRLGVLTTASYTVIVLVAVVTSMMAPPLLRFAASRIATTEEESVREEFFDALQAPAGEFVTTAKET